MDGFSSFEASVRFFGGLSSIRSESVWEIDRAVFSVLPNTYGLFSDGHYRRIRGCHFKRSESFLESNRADVLGGLPIRSESFLESDCADSKHPRVRVEL
jgi:hypothetical protein